MAAEAFIQCRVPQAMKVALRAAAEGRQLTESALLKRMLELVLHTGGAADIGDAAVAADRPARQARLYVRLATGDRQLLLPARDRLEGDDVPADQLRECGRALLLAGHFRRNFESHFAVPGPAQSGRAMRKGPAFPVHYRRASTNAHDCGVAD